MELLEAVFQRLPFAAFPAHGCVFGGELFEVLADQTRKRCVPLDRKFSNFLYEFMVQR